MDTAKLTYAVTDGGRAERGYRGENNDCVVKSLAIALGRPYEVIHSELRSRGRINGTGTKRWLWTNYVRTLPEVKELTDIPEKRTNFWRFFHKHQTGTFLVCVTQHLTVIRDGVCLDEIPPRPRMLVRCAFQVMHPCDTWSDYVI
jgi:hypothetical protein